jgi:NADH-quinone oxidoreductase subunit E
MTTEMTPLLTPDMKEAIQAFLPRYPDPRAALLPALHVVQEKFRCVPLEARDEIAELLGVSAAEVHDAASFYHGVFSDEPIGRHRIWVCRSLSCALLGGEALLERLAGKLGLEPHGNATTDDGMFTLEAVECLGLCDGAPAMIIDGEVHTELTEAKVDQILGDVRAKDAG